MNATLKRIFVILAISAMLVGSSVLVAVNAANNENEEPVGKEIASTFREIVKTHQNDIENFILETKVDMAPTSEAKLDIVKGYTDALKEEIAALNSTREALIAAFQAGTIEKEDFRMGMKDLAVDLVTAAKTMGELGEKLGELGPNLAGDLKARADQLVASLQAFAQEMATAGQAIANQMSKQGLPIPEIPALPEIPQIPMQPRIPSRP